MANEGGPEDLETGGPDPYEAHETVTDPVEPNRSPRRFLDHGPAPDLSLFFSTAFGDSVGNLIADLRSRLATGSGGPPAACVGIFGPWGSGKTSVARQVLDQLSEEALAVYFAPSHLSARPEDVQALLQQQVLFAAVKHLSEGSSESPVVRSLENLFRQQNIGRDATPTDARSSIFDLAARLSELVASLGVHSGLAETVLEHLLDSIPVVIAVDDLDRCSPELIARLLKVSIYWAERTATSFMFVGDEKHLRAAARLNAAEIGGEAYDGQALEKYVHRWLHVPVGWRLEEGWKAACELLRPVVPDQSTPLGTQLNENFDESDHFHLLGRPDGIVEGVVVPMTPRAFKRRLDRFLESYYALESSHPRSCVGLAALAAYHSPWEQLIVNLDVDAISTLQQFVSVCEAVPADAAPSLFESFYRNAFEGSISLPLGVAREVVRLHRSTGQADASGSAERQGVLSGAGRGPLGAPHQEADGNQNAVLVDDSEVFGRLRQQTLQAKREGEFLSEMERIRRESTELEARLGPSACVHLIGEMMSLCSQFKSDYGSIPRKAAAQVGNQALLAERAKWLDAALTLHEAAREADPLHPNAAQNWVEFIIDNRIDIDDVGFRDAATQACRDLVARSFSHKSYRTVWFLIILSRHGSVGEAEIAELFGRLDADDQGRALSLAINRRHRDFAAGVYASLFDALLGAISDRAALGRVLRQYADSNDESDEQKLTSSEVLDLYRSIIQFRLVENDVRLAQVLYNFSIEVRQSPVRNAEQLAFGAFRSAYALTPDAPDVRGSFSRFLSDDLNDEQLAELVNTGQPLPDESPSYPAHVEMPARFSNEEHWWERHVRRFA